MSEISLILSEEFDISTNQVIDWFLYYKRTFKRHNGNTHLSHLKSFSKFNNYNFDEREIEYLICNKSDSKKNIYFQSCKETINSIWFRRPNFDSVSKPNKKNAFDKKIDKYLFYNEKIFKEYFFKSLVNTKKIGSFNIIGLNKPLVLEMAKKIGFEIPNTIVTNTKNKLSFFFKKNNCKIINKALHESFKHGDPEKNYWITNRTEEIHSLKNIPKYFKPSLFQEQIEKKYEIRVFFLYDTCYSACIFSQRNQSTAIDFRNYDRNKPNRIVPYNLPKKIELKIKLLMNNLELNTGSIDLIMSQDDKYVFLEINPVGQYDFVAKPCNYPIDLDIYKILTK